MLPVRFLNLASENNLTAKFQKNVFLEFRRKNFFNAQIKNRIVTYNKQNPYFTQIQKFRAKIMKNVGVAIWVQSRSRVENAT